ncbi:MAG: prepilin-type N-terminal cleavage/methylation domain-containing protein [Clostridiales Family XIII bacterium]|jgi:prepilin-type N-terminal cleavage/methylation domain-containing protein|nr:prepilin-type N-terminal cleavage/methylation domain-containing protein [Clostridiales Family XIII bacterium]
MNKIMQKMAPRSVPCRFRARRGFTLVEVIVVLVILAILAAIAIPALTGYIDKANDKRYISDARNAVVAVRTVLNEAYADGRIAASAEAEKYFSGKELYDSNPGAAHFDLLEIGDILLSDEMGIYKKAAVLMGEPYPDDHLNEKSWVLIPVAARNVGATASTADGFVYVLYPKGQGGPFDTVVAVTYKVDRIMTDGWVDLYTKLQNGSTYNSKAGYEVYRFD